MGAKIEKTLVATIRQEFLGGASLRELANKHGVGLRTLATRSKEEGWAAERDRQRIATRVPALDMAADAHAEAVARSWGDRLTGIIQTTAGIVESASLLLAHQDLRECDFRDLASLLNLLVDAIRTLQTMLINSVETGELTPETARAYLERHAPNMLIIRPIQFALPDLARSTIPLEVPDERTADDS